jgi:hypothetical protein
MNQQLFRAAVTAFAFISSAGGAAAQSADVRAERPVVTAIRLEPDERIALDGRLSEEAWQRATPASGFKQSDPRFGAPATEDTEIRVLFDREALFIGVELLDSDPTHLLGNQMLRDGALDGDDRFMWTLDPFYDQRSGYYFEINPAGAMGDAQLVVAPGNTFGVAQNRAWNGIWNARVVRHERGWTAEIVIPFRTLNFDPDAPAWGINFQRTVGRKNEESFWTGFGRNEGLMALASAGRLEGVAGVSQGHGLDIKPYAIGTYTDAPGRGVSSLNKGDAGVDFFYSVTPQLKTNITINTDFAQTEVDDRQVNLTRFALFFPEKRDFFLEGAGNFDFSRDPVNNLSGFFSRRIGLTDAGLPQKIDFGAKMIGRAGNFDLGFLQVRTGREGSVLGDDFTVFRPKRRFLSQSYAGLLYTRRSTRDSTLADRHTIGADFQIVSKVFGSQNIQYAGYFMKTPTETHSGDDAAFGLRVDYPNDRWNGRVFYREIQKNADPAVGFVEDRDYRKLTSMMLFRPRPRNNRWVRQVSTGVRNELFTDTQGQWIERNYQVTVADVSFQSGDRAAVIVTPTYERLHQPFRIGGGITLLPGSEYQYTRYAFTANTASRRKISIDSTVANGTFYSGHRRELSASVNLRPRAGLFATVTSSFNRVELAEGQFSVKILRALVNTQFSPVVSVSNNVQYDSVSRQIGWQFRFRWILTPGTDFYFVSLGNWLDTGDRYAILDRNASTKVMYTYRF